VLLIEKSSYAVRLTKRQATGSFREGSNLVASPNRCEDFISNTANIGCHVD